MVIGVVSRKTLHDGHATNCNINHQWGRVGGDGGWGWMLFQHQEVDAKTRAAKNSYESTSCSVFINIIILSVLYIQKSTSFGPVLLWHPVKPTTAGNQSNCIWWALWVNIRPRTFSCDQSNLHHRHVAKSEPIRLIDSDSNGILDGIKIPFSLVCLVSMGSVGEKQQEKSHKWIRIPKRESKGFIIILCAIRGIVS